MILTAHVQKELAEAALLELGAPDVKLTVSDCISFSSWEDAIEFAKVYLRKQVQLQQVLPTPEASVIKYAEYKLRELGVDTQGITGHTVRMVPDSYRSAHLLTGSYLAADLEIQFSLGPPQTTVEDVVQGDGTINRKTIVQEVLSPWILVEDVPYVEGQCGYLRWELSSLCTLG